MRFITIVTTVAILAISMTRIRAEELQDSRSLPLANKTTTIKFEIFYLKDKNILAVFKDSQDPKDIAIRERILASDGIFTVTAVGIDAQGTAQQPIVRRYRIGKGNDLVQLSNEDPKKFEPVAGIAVDLPSEFVTFNITIEMKGLTPVELKGVYRSVQTLKVAMPLEKSPQVQPHCGKRCRLFRR